jgi:hypothetical protein
MSSGMMQMIRTLLLLTVSCSLAGACASEGSTPAPTISDLRVAPDSLSVGALNEVTLDVRFEDQDANVLEALVSITGADGVRGAESAVRVVGASGLSVGDVSVQLQIQPPATGTYTVTLVLRDDAGNDSNPLTAELVAR